MSQRDQQGNRLKQPLAPPTHGQPEQARSATSRGVQFAAGITEEHNRPHQAEAMPRAVPLTDMALLVDDDPASRRVLFHTLSSRVMKPKAVAGGLDALEEQLNFTNRINCGP